MLRLALAVLLLGFWDGCWELGHQMTQHIGPCARTAGDVVGEQGLRHHIHIHTAWPNQICMQGVDQMLGRDAAGFAFDVDGFIPQPIAEGHERAEW